MQQPVGEDVAPFRIGAELYFVHRQEIRPPSQGHCLDCADEITGSGGQDFFFARHQGDCGGAFLRHHAVIDFPRQQTQRQADHAGAVTQHPLHRQMGFAGVGRSQNSRDAATLLLFPVRFHPIYKGRVLGRELQASSSLPSGHLGCVDRRRRENQCRWQGA